MQRYHRSASAPVTFKCIMVNKFKKFLKTITSTYIFMLGVIHLLSIVSKYVLHNRIAISVCSCGSQTMMKYSDDINIFEQTYREEYLINFKSHRICVLLKLIKLNVTTLEVKTWWFLLELWRKWIFVLLEFCIFKILLSPTM